MFKKNGGGAQAASLFSGVGSAVLTCFSALLWYSSISLVRSNLGFLRTLTFLMQTFSRGKILEQSFVIFSETDSARLN